MITGPGNVYVAAAKRLVQGRCGIDSEAGPTEVAVLADDTAVPAFVAADLVAQAEHDPLAACLLVTPSTALADAVDAELGRQVAGTRHRERVETALAGQSAVVVVDDLDHGLEVVDAWGAEHLEVQTADARERALLVRNAGAVFVGNHTPVSLGDYLAGSNHVLPTGGTARFSSGLSAQSFLKRMSLVEYTPQALADVTARVAALGTAEDLAAHVDAVAVRSRVG
jgi:histidinol dehydrogenase